MLFSRNAADLWTDQTALRNLPEDDSSSDSEFIGDASGLLDVQYRSVRLATMALREVLENVGVIDADGTDPVPFRITVIFDHFEALEHVPNLSLSYVHWLFSLHASTIRNGINCIVNTVFISTRLFGILQCMPYNFLYSGSIPSLQVNWRRFSQAESINILAADDRICPPGVNQPAILSAITLIVDMFFHAIGSLDALSDVCSFAINRTFKGNADCRPDQNVAQIRKLLIKVSNLILMWKAQENIIFNFRRFFLR